MVDKLTYQELENQIAELQKQNEIIRLNSFIQYEERYHSLFNNIEEGFARCQMLYENDEPIDFKYLEVNNAFEKLTGLKKVVGKRISEILVNHKTENPKLFNLYERVSRTGVSERIETFIASLDKWFSISVYSSLKDEFLVVFDNITEQKKAEKKIKESEAQFRGLFKQSHVGTVIADLDKCIIRCNEAFCRFLGYPEKEIIGKTVAHFTYPKDREIGMDEVNRMAKEEIEFARVQKRYLRKDGTVVWGELTINVVRNEYSKPLYYLTVIQDVTERHRKRKAIKESEARFKQLIKNSFDMVVLIDSKGIQHFVSESCEKILGYKQEELIGISVIEKMIHPEDQEITKKGFLDIIKNKANGGVQYRHLHKNGSWVYLEAYGNNQLDNPIIKSVVLNVRDISERKLAAQIIKENEIHLKQLNATKDKFFSIIAHDLKSPFNSMLGFSEILNEKFDEYNTEKQKKFISLINQELQGTYKLLENLLSWSRSQRGAIDFKPERLNLCLLVNETNVLLINLAENKSLNLINQIPENINVEADRDMFLTIIRNLISNAIKFTPKGGEISIKAKLANDNKFIQILVTDNGVGISKEIQSKLFDIGENTSTQGTENESGTGLGLILCREFVERHGGKIWVESDVEIGSKFYFTIPLD